MMVHSLVSAAVAVLAWILVGSMTADVVEDSQTQTGRRAEGLFFAGPNLIQKSVSGIGLMIKGILLSVVGFSAEATRLEKIAAVEQLAVAIVIISVILPSLALYLFSKYEITRNRHDANLDQLGYGEGKPTP
jgi:GPH family glycoside/pentoside/hexuronide:cation symporter